MDEAATPPRPVPAAATSSAAAGRANALALSEDVMVRLNSAAAMLRVSPNDLIHQLLCCFYCSLRGLPSHVLLYIFSFLDYSTVSSLVSATCRSWHDGVRKGEPSKFFSDLRQVHGVHVIDPARGVFYFPRALKRVLVVANNDGAQTQKAAPTAPHRLAASSSSAQRLSAVTSDMATPASSFLTVDIRTQDTRSMPWANVRSVVQLAIETERVVYGEVRSPGLQRPEEPALTQAAVTTYNRMVYVFGGESYEGVVLSRCYAYNPIRKHWSRLPQLREARAGACAAAFGGRIFVFGGYNESGETLDTYEVLDVGMSRWLNPVVSNGSRGFHMPSKACGLAVAPYEDVLFLAGGYRCRLAPEDTAFTYSIADSTTATPMQGLPPGADSSPPSWMASGGAGRANHSTPAPDASQRSAAVAPANAPTSAMTAHSISRDGPLDAEAWVWVFSPRKHTWCVDGPPLPSPRAFGGLAVLELLPALGPCLCYFGGCAKADTPETAMYYIPLATDPQGSADSPPPATDDDDEEEDSGNSNSCSREGEDGGGGVGGDDDGDSDSDGPHDAAEVQPSLGFPSDDALPQSPVAEGRCATPRAHVERGKPAKDAALLRHFRRERVVGGGRTVLCEWQRYARIPLGGAFTSVAVLGTAESRTVVLSSFYPAALIGYCKVKDLVPADVALRLSRVLSPPREPSLAPRSANSAHDQSANASPNSSPTLGDHLVSPVHSLPVPLDTSLQLEAFDTAQQQRHLEHEWSQHQRRELRRLMGAAATAASHRRPIAPQTAGEERKWSLAPMPEIQVRDDHGRPLLNRVSWKTQSLNGKFVVAIE